MRILLVEDEPRLAKTLAKGMQAEGFVVVATADGQEALWRGSEEQFDAIVLDIMLPGLSGYEVLRQLRAKKVWTPVIMLTAKDGEYDETDAFELGADDYLTKPFRFRVLIARLRALVRRGAPRRPVVLSAGTLTLDPANRVVTRDGTGYLTSKLPPVAPGQTYQLWGVSRSGTISLGVLGRAPKTIAFKAAVPTQSLAITTEAAGGVPVSRNAPDVVGDIT